MTPLRTDPAPATAERRLVTVVFTDLVGFTALAEDRDPEAVRELLSRYFETATEIVRQHGGTVEKFIGDAVMAVWGTPVAHEDDAERAVRAALELIDAVQPLHPNLQARAGVLTGEAAVTLGATNQGMVAGDLVNTAARLQGVAEPGTVLVGEATRRAAERAIVFEPIGDHSVKGKISPVPAWRAVRVVAARGGQGRADALEAPFVGRDEELRQLKEVLHAVGRERRPRLVSVTGPGGIGKSRLVWELEKYVDGVTEPIFWHRGRSPSYGEGISFWALGEIVRRRAQLSEDDDEAATRERIAATVAEYVPAADERQRIGTALLSLLGVEPAPAGGRDALFPAWRLFFERVAEKGTTVLVFEDLQWADTGMLDFIDHLLDWSRGLPLMVLTLARPELFDRRPDWGAGRRQLTALALEPLSDGAIRELLEGLVPGLPPDALAAIVGRAEGIPLYAVETVRALLSDGRIEAVGDAYRPVGDLSTMAVPESLRSLIASRLDGLDSGDRALVQDAAVLGQVFSADALGAVSGIALDDLRPRLHAFVRRELIDVETDPVSPERGQFRFVQSLVREVAYGTLARRDRRARHLAVARHYEASGEEALAGALASHYVAAHEASDEGPESDAIAVQARLALSAAAERAADLGAHDQAIRYLEQAIALATEDNDRATLLDRAAISADAAAAPAAEDYARAAVDAYRDAGDVGASVHATARLGRVLLDASQILKATKVLEGAVGEAEALDDQAPLASALAQLARAYMRGGDGARAVEAADRALPIAERLNLEAVVVEAFVSKGSGLSLLGRRRESVALQVAALESVERLGDRSMELRIRNNLASALSDDEPVRAAALTWEGAVLARDIGNRGMYHWLLGNAALGRRSEGRDWDEMTALLDEAYQATTLRSDRLRMRVFIGLFDLARGERIDEFVADVTDLVGNSTDVDDLFSIAMVTGQAAMARGDIDTAWRTSMDAVALNAQNPEVALTRALQVAIRAGWADRIREVAQMISELPAAGAVTQTLKLYASAAASAVSGRAADAVDGFREADRRMIELGQLFDGAEMAVDAVTLLPGQPDLRANATRARELLVELRAKPLVAQVDATLAEGAPSPSTVVSAASAPVVSE